MPAHFLSHQLQAPSHNLRFALSRRLLQFFEGHAIGVVESGMDKGLHPVNVAQNESSVLHVTNPAGTIVEVKRSYLPLR